MSGTSVTTATSYTLQGNRFLSITASGMATGTDQSAYHRSWSTGAAHGGDFASYQVSYVGNLVASELFTEASSFTAGTGEIQTTSGTANGWFLLDEHLTIDASGWGDKHATSNYTSTASSWQSATDDTYHTSVNRSDTLLLSGSYRAAHGWTATGGFTETVDVLASGSRNGYAVVSLSLQGQSAGQGTDPAGSSTSQGTYSVSAWTHVTYSELFFGTANNDDYSVSGTGMLDVQSDSTWILT